MQPLIGIEIPIRPSHTAQSSAVQQECLTVDVRVEKLRDGYRAKSVSRLPKGVARTTEGRTGQRAIEEMVRTLAEAGMRGTLRVVK